MMQKKNKDTLTIGFALFAMFFGAGNLLLPPFIGLQIADQVLLTVFAFALTGILLPFFGVLSVVQSGNSFQDLGDRIHPYLAPVLGSIIMLCIGPLIAIPRTAATTYEVGLKSSFPEFSAVWSSIIFFAITWVLSIVPSKVVDIIGNILTPGLLILLLLLIFVGVISPQGDYSSSDLSSLQAFSLGFTEGYQTLDVLASVIFAGIIIAAAQSKGYVDSVAKSKVVIASGALSAICLLLVYGGLLFLGARSGVEDQHIGRSALLIHIARSNLGEYGMIAIALAIALACLTTAIALTSAVGTFFSKLSGGRIGYKTLVTICCVFSGMLSISGVDNIIQFAYPPLAFVYPIVITLVLYIVLFGRVVSSKAPFIGALAASAMVAALSFVKVLGLWSEDTLLLLDQIPFFSIDLGWVIPSAIGFVVGLLLDRNREKKLQSI